MFGTKFENKRQGEAAGAKPSAPGAQKTSDTAKGLPAPRLELGPYKQAPNNPDLPMVIKVLQNRTTVRFIL
jgi:hypothetical protein